MAYKRLPDEDGDLFPKNIDHKKLKANCSIFCPELKFWTGPTIACYNCEIGFKGECDSLNKLVSEKPKILEEIYRPYPELIKLEFKQARKALVFKDKLISISSVSKVDTKLAYVVTGKYQLNLRFIPKYEKVESELSKTKFWDKSKRKVLPFDEIPYVLETGNILYSVKKDKKYLDSLILAEKLK